MTDEIIGIETTNGSRVCYFGRSTLVNTGGYFAARFRDDGGIPAGGERRDELGRRVYFVERDGILFETYICPFILTNRLGHLPSFPKDPELWRRLRDEALFYALDDLSELLHVTHVCDRHDPLGRGVLYYLGTNKGTEDYQNPHARGAVSIGGWINNTEMEQQWSYDMARALAPSSSQVFVQYRSPVCGDTAQSLGQRIQTVDPCGLFPCDFNDTRNRAVSIDLQTIRVLPKAYSLRYGECFGASCWNFEGSEDGIEWTVLHEARNDQHLKPPPTNMLDLWQNQDLFPLVERNLRHTWTVELSSPKFFRYFRVVSVELPEMDEDSRRDKMCVHVVGLEIFGEIHED